MVRLIRAARILALVLLALSVTDWWLTRTALTLGATELNPLMRGVVSSPAAFYVLKVGLVAVLAGIAGLVVRSDRGLKHLTVIVGFYVLVVGWNVASLYTLT